MTNKEILKILATEQIGDQHELLKIIEGRGYSMTQSTLSRRLKKLGVKKKHGIYMAPNVVQGAMPGLLKRIDEAPPNLLVLHTSPGHAQALAYQLDYISANDPESVTSLTSSEDTGFPEIIGTVAGDDTVLIVTKPEHLRSLKEKISKHWQSL